MQLMLTGHTWTSICSPVCGFCDCHLIANSYYIALRRCVPQRTCTPSITMHARLHACRQTVCTREAELPYTALKLLVTVCQPWIELKAFQLQSFESPLQMTQLAAMKETTWIICVGCSPCRDQTCVPLLAGLQIWQSPRSSLKDCFFCVATRRLLLKRTLECCAVSIT